MFYQEKYRIPSLVCDASDHLSLWGLSRLFQEVAEGHTFATGIGYDALIKQNKAWVLCRMRYEVNQMPKMWDTVTLTTWSRGTNGLFAVRDFRMEDEQSHQLLASATAYWAVIDFNTRHVTRLHDLMSNYEHHELKATSAEELHKICPPKEFKLNNSTLDSNAPQSTNQFIVQQFVALPSMLDHTHHVNNAEYLKWISNHWPQIGIQPPVDADSSIYVPTFKPFALQVDYILETRLNEVITIHRFPNNPQYYQETSNCIDKTSTLKNNSIDSELSSNSHGTFFFQISNSRGIAANIELSI